MFYKVVLENEDGERETLVRSEESAEAAREWGETLDESTVVSVEDFTARVEAVGQRVLAVVLDFGTSLELGSEDRLAADFLWNEIREGVLGLG